MVDYLAFFDDQHGNSTMGPPHARILGPPPLRFWHGATRGLNPALHLPIHACVSSSSALHQLHHQSVAAPEGRSRVGFSLCEAAERRRREERGVEGSRRRRRRDERRRREGRGAYGASTLAPSALVSAPMAPRPLGASLVTPSAASQKLKPTLLLPSGAATGLRR